MAGTEQESLNSYFRSLSSYFQSLNAYFETVANTRGGGGNQIMVPNITSYLGASGTRKHTNI